MQRSDSRRQWFILFGLIALAGAVMGLILWLSGRQTKPSAALQPATAGLAAAGQGGAAATETADLRTCIVCGMQVRRTDPWAARLRFQDGKERAFCTPRCMFVYMLQWLPEETKGQMPGRDRIAGAWVRDYYSRSELRAEDAVFVVGSDIAGPMGHDLVPVSQPGAARQLVADHRGRVVGFEQVDDDLVKRVIAGTAGTAPTRAASPSAKSLPQH